MFHFLVIIREKYKFYQFVQNVPNKIKRKILGGKNIGKTVMCVYSTCEKSMSSFSLIQNSSLFVIPLTIDDWLFTPLKNSVAL